MHKAELQELKVELEEDISKLSTLKRLDVIDEDTAMQRAVDLDLRRHNLELEEGLWQVKADTVRELRVEHGREGDRLSAM